MIQALSFYGFSTILVLSALAVVFSKNPVHSVLFLILAFFDAAGLFVLLGAEFLAMLLVVVYVGAVAVLFLFVVMMIDIDISAIKKQGKLLLIAGLLLGSVMLAQLYLVYDISGTSTMPVDTAAQLARFDSSVGTAPIKTVSNAKQIGLVLYTDYMIPFFLASIVLFVAMIGAIVLTLRYRPDVRRQKVRAQLDVTPEQAMSVEKIELYKGI
jgi:NADH-quinone oxidoreductase subunit J